MSGDLRVLIADKMSPVAASVLRAAGLTVDERFGISPEELIETVGSYDVLLVRSRTKVTAGVIASADRLKIVGRGGIGVDNIDIDAATERGVMVMNAPHGNATTTAELAIAHLFGLARNLVNAGASMREGKWEKKRFMGRQVAGSTLAVVGLGNIGRIVAQKALALDMNVRAYDPFVSADDVRALGYEPCETVEGVVTGADFVTVHTPLTDGTRGMIGAEAFAAMKSTGFLIQCARGGVVDEDALLAALNADELAGAALDVFVSEPPGATPLATHPKVHATPHLGASSHEAQDLVAEELVGQVADYFATGEQRNVLNLSRL